MPAGDQFVFMIAGSVFIVLGVGLIIWGYREEKSYYNSISTRRDVREFLERWPRHPQPGALKAGGWIAIAVGLVLLAVAAYFWVGA